MDKSCCKKLYICIYTILQDSIRNARTQMEMKLLKPLEESAWMDALSGDHIRYIHQANKVVIPPHILNPPLFHRNYPK